MRAQVNGAPRLGRAVVASAWLLLMITLGGSAAWGQSSETPPPPDLTVPLPDGSVFYVRYGEPGGVQVNSRFVATDSTQATKPNLQAEDDTVYAAPPAPAPVLSVEVLRRLIREELAARRVPPATEPVRSETTSLVAPSSPPAKKTWLDETLGTGLKISEPGSVPPSSSSDPASLVRIDGSARTVLPPAERSAADTKLEADAELAAMRATEQALLTQNLDRAKASVDSLSALLRESRPEVIREQILEGGLFRTSLILFASGQAALAPRSREVIEVVGQVLNDFPQLRLRIEGHADSRGPADRNLLLSQQRAESVGSYLRQCCGISADRLEAAGLGEQQPLSTGTSPTDLAVNRRVEFRVLNPEALTTRRP